MKRLNRKEEAVSPVIATILMVAITVVLAATLYMMVGGFGENGVTEEIGMTISERSTNTGENITLGLGMRTPSSADMEDVTVVVFDADGDVVIEEDPITDDDDQGDEVDVAWITYRGAGADDDEITDGARLRLELSDWDGYTVEISIDGYSGQASRDL